MKDHATFARAARVMADRRDDVRFICVGEGIEPYRSEALRELHVAGLGDRLLWKGFCKDMVAFYNCVDIATSTSLFGEGFSNAIGEAMACGTPCVVTDVGDSARILGATGAVVKAGDPGALATAWEEVLKRTDPEQRSACRRRIVETFGLDSLIRHTESALGL